MGQGQLSQSFPVIFEPPLSGFNMHLVVVNLWLISFFKINSKNLPPTNTHTHIPRNSIIKLSEAKRQIENLERRKKCVTKKGISKEKQTKKPKNRNCWPRILYLAKMFSKLKGKLTHSHINKSRGSLLQLPTSTLLEVPNWILQVEIKGH